MEKIERIIDRRENKPWRYIPFLPSSIKIFLYFKIIIHKYYKLLTSPIRVLPDFLIIGAQRSGTTSLYNYLTKHPSIVSALREGIHYFDRYYYKSIYWYKTFFPSKFIKFFYIKFKISPIEFFLLILRSFRFFFQISLIKEKYKNLYQNEFLWIWIQFFNIKR